MGEITITLHSSFCSNPLINIPLLKATQIGLQKMEALNKHHGSNRIIPASVERIQDHKRGAWGLPNKHATDGRQTCFLAHIPRPEGTKECLRAIINANLTMVTFLRTRMRPQNSLHFRTEPDGNKFQLVESVLDLNQPPKSQGLHARRSREFSPLALLFTWVHLDLFRTS